MVNQHGNAGKISQNKYKRINIKHGSHPPFGWLNRTHMLPKLKLDSHL